jgi:phosphoribosylglycinamide formyltransferase-1
VSLRSSSEALVQREKPPVGILISGRGSNMEALIEAAKDPAYPAQIAVVIANNPDAEGLATAAAAGIRTALIDHRPYGKDRAAHERAIDDVLREAGVKYIALAGYMRVLTPFLVEAWAGRMINIHPSLLPLYPGLHTHARALEAGDAKAGCTVHLVTAGVDEGPILGQAEVTILPGDNEQSLALRVLEQEHRLYPASLARLILGPNAPETPNE